MLSLINKNFQILDGKKAAGIFQRNFENNNRVKKTKLRNHDDLARTKVLILLDCKIPTTRTVGVEDRVST